MRFVELIFILIFVGVGLINVIARLIMSRAKKKKQALSTKAQAESSAVTEGEAAEHHAAVSEGEIQEVEAVTRSAVVNVYEERRKNIQEVIISEEESREEKEELESASYMNSGDRATQGPIMKRIKATAGVEKPLPVAQEVKASSGWQKIDSLPPLQRAVILSEILGKPKGME